MAETGGKQFGKYRVVREISQAGASTIYAARPEASADATVAIKVLRVPDFLSPAEARRRIEAFLARAASYKRIVEALASNRKNHWASIYDEPASLPDGAFYVTDLFPRSADALADARRPPVAVMELFEVVRQVCQGLGELESIAGRPHGNLKPGNVLLRGRGRALHAFLTDPLDEKSIDRKAGAALDLKALGRLIFRLVVRAEAPDEVGDQLPDKPQWQALGLDGSQWRALCAKLLSADRNGLSLQEASEEIESLRPKAGGQWKLTAVVAAVIAIVISIALIWASIQKKRNAPAFAYLNQQWDTLNLGQLQGTQQQKAQSLSLYRDQARADDAVALDEIIGSMSRLQPPRSLSGYGSWHLGAYPSIRRESEQIEQIQLQISKIVESRLKDHAGLDLNNPVQVVIQLPLRLGWQDGISKARSAEQSLKKSQAADPFIKDLTDAVESDMQIAPDFADHPLDVKTRLTRLNAVASATPQIEAILTGGYDTSAISRQDALRYASGGHSGQAATELIGQWLADAQAFKLLTPDTRSPEMWAVQFKALDNQIKALGVSSAAQELSDELNALKQHVNPWLKQQLYERDQKSLQADERQYQGELKELQHKVELQQVNPTVLNDLLEKDLRRAKIGPLQELLRKNGRALIGKIKSRTDVTAARQQLDFLSGEVTKCAARLDVDANPIFSSKAATPMLRDAENWVKEVNQVAMGRRDDLFRSLPNELPSSQPQITQLFESISQEWIKWRDQTQKLVDQLARVQSPLCPAGGLYTPDETNLGQPTVRAQAAAWHVDFKRWLDDLRRVDAHLAERVEADPLAKINRSSIAELGNSSDPAAAGLLLADWLAVPEQVNESGLKPIAIDQDLTAWKSLRDDIAKVPDSGRKTGLQLKLSKELELHFQAWAKHPDSNVELPASPPELRYDCALYDLIRLTRTASADDKKIEKALDELINASSQAGQLAFSKALKAAAKDLSADPRSVPGWGPGQLQTEWEMSERDGGIVRFTSTDQARAVLEFARIESDGGNGTYLGTCEFSTDLLIRLFRAHQSQIKLSKSRGPKAWDLQMPGDRQNAATLTTASRWINDIPTGTALDFYNGQVTNDVPSGDSPATSISPVVASKLAELLHCRLPTVDEWKAALSDERNAKGNLASSQWVLRGKAWRHYVDAFNEKYQRADKADPTGIEIDRLRDVAPGNWGWFGSDDPKYQKSIREIGPDGRAAADEPSFFFSPEPRPGDARLPGHRFYHLIGNAAEIVTSSVNGTQYSVIGGSAFSPPEMGYDIPQTVKSPDQQWSDVGFRLAISAPIKPMRDRLAKLLQDPPFIRVP